MITFIEASRIGQIHTVAVVIVLFCFFLILVTQQNHHHAKARHRIVGIFGSVLFFSLFVILMLIRGHMLEESEMPDVLDFVSRLPMVFFAVLFCAGLAVLVYESIYDIRRFRSFISENSILQAVNDLSDGIVVFDKNMRIVFSNKIMYQLSFSIFGQSLYKFASFYEMINNGYCGKDVYFLPQLPLPSYYLPSGEVWQIRHVAITVDGDIYDEFVASDITRQYNLRLKIEEENALLIKRKILISQTAKEIIESNVKEEQLAYKMKIHDSLGQCVTAVSHVLRDTGDVEAGIKLWKEAIEGLRTFEDTDMSEKENRAFHEQLRLIQQLGCTVKHEGPMPGSHLQAQIFRDAIRTAAINAVRHGKADMLFVETKKEDRDFKITIWDNGNVHIETITEGGGLSSLRKKVNGIKGEMAISLDQGVKICIKLPPPPKI